MSTSQSQPVHPHRFAVRFGERTLPKSGSPAMDTDNTSMEQPYEVLQTEVAFSELSSHLEIHVSQLVLGGDSILNAFTLKQAIECYASQIGRLHQLCSEWSGMLATLTRVAGTMSGMTIEHFLPGQLKMEIDTWRTELLHEADANGIVYETIVTAKLAAKSLSDLKSELSGHVEKSITGTKHKFLEQLVALVDGEVFGIIEWFAEDKCAYHHFTRQCVVEHDRTTIDVQRAPINLGETIRKRKFQFTGTTKRSLVRRIQHLVNARSLPPDQVTLPVPRNQLVILEALPPWIAPAIEIVEGTLIRETVVTQEQDAHQWEEQRVVEDKVVWHNDPAIVLGPFVLSAWGQKEIEGEVALREQEELAAKKAQQPVERTISTHKLFGFMLLMVACVFMVGWRFSFANLLLGFLCGGAAAGLLSTRWKKELEARGENDYAFGYAISAVVTSLLAMMLIPAGLIIAGFIFFVLALLALGLYAQRTSEWDEVKEDVSPSIRRQVHAP